MSSRDGSFQKIRNCVYTCKVIQRKLVSFYPNTVYRLAIWADIVCMTCYVLAYTQRAGPTISSSVWQMLVLSSQHRPCGTTRCVVSIQVLYLLQQQSLCIVRTIYHPSDTSSFSFLWLTTWICVSLRVREMPYTKFLLFYWLMLAK